MEPEGSLLPSEQPTSNFYPEPDNPVHIAANDFDEIHLHIFHLGSSNVSGSIRFSYQHYVFIYLLLLFMLHALSIFTGLTSSL
jgi:hypothetical protein